MACQFLYLILIRVAVGRKEFDPNLVKQLTTWRNTVGHDVSTSSRYDFCAFHAFVKMFVDLLVFVAVQFSLLSDPKSATTELECRNLESIESIA